VSRGVYPMNILLSRRIEIICSNKASHGFNTGIGVDISRTMGRPLPRRING